MLRTFDFASPDTHAPGRFVTSVPQQTLYLRNSPFVIEQALSLATRVKNDSTKQRESASSLFQAVLGREPSNDEVTLAEQFLNEAALDVPPAPIWQYGFGEYDTEAKSLKTFLKLPHWTGSQWQGGPNLPDEKHGWVLWNANGGHPGEATHSADR